MLKSHLEIAAQQQKLIAAVMAGDKKQAVAAMRAVRKALNHELDLARAIARATYVCSSSFYHPVVGQEHFIHSRHCFRNDPEMRDRLEAVCANAQRQIDQLMGQLGDLAELALMDPSNEELRGKLEAVLGEAQAISAKLVAACGQDLLIQSNRALGDRLAGTF